MGREPKLLVAIGRKGSGKSYTTRKMIDQYVLGNPARGVPGRRALILDVNDEYYDIKALRIQDVTLFSVHPMDHLTLQPNNFFLKMRQTSHEKLAVCYFRRDCKEK